MYRHHLCFLRCVTFTALLLAIQPGFAQPSANTTAPGSIVAAFLDEQTLFVARLDMRQIDAAALIGTLGRLAPPDDQEFPKELTKLEQRAKDALRVLNTAGVSELYAVVSLTDFPKEPLFVVAPVKPGSDSQAAATALQQLFRFERADARPGLVVLGKTATIERLKTLRPVLRPEFAKGFERLGNAGLQVVFTASDDTRRVLREMLPRLPDEIGGGSGKTLADGLQWAAISVQLPPKLSLSATIQSRDPESAAALRGMIISVLQLLGRQPDVRRHWPQVDDLGRLLTPRLSGDQLLLNISEKSSEMEQVLRLAITRLQAARTAAGRQQSFNNLKQLGLAIHNHHDTHGRLPPQAVRGKDGKALLSWRVAILPFLDAEPLYKQFHLDEPWDSEHNKKLIEKMPAVFASPSLGDELRAKGLTSYLAPLSDQPPAIAIFAAEESKKTSGQKKDQTIFDPPEGTKFQQITDGTSNTILIVEAHPKSAAIWTKPDDLVIDPTNPAKELRGQPNDGFSCLFADGSARFIKASIDAKTLLHLLQMNDGHVIGDF
jgi:hypothetical protein